MENVVKDRVSKAVMDRDKATDRTTCKDNRQWAAMDKTMAWIRDAHLCLPWGKTDKAECRGNLLWTDRVSVAVANRMAVTTWVNLR